MANTKTYKIVINGVQESINAVDSLNKQLNDLEQRMNTLNSKGVNVKTQGGGNLDDQDKLEKQILATEEKLAQVRDENYKKLLHMKEELKEYTQIAKSQVAAESNAQGLYDTSTMAGMKASLKSIKAEMQMVEVGGDRFQELTRQANELNNKLKEIEQSYGQFGRNVGNYAAGVAEGMSKLKVEVNGVTEEFDTAKKAMKTLRNEMQTLSTKKDMGLISEAEEERLKGLIPVVKQLESSIADAGKPMDALLDTMQSVMAIASVGQGIGALFGMDDGEIEKTIQKLVALQNVMQGLQVLQNQMQSGEGIGGWLAKGNAAIDKFVAGLIGTTNATKAATVATKAFGVALKTLGIGLIVVAITELISLYKDWSDAQEKAAKEAEEAAARIKKAADDQRNAFVNASAQYMNTASRLSQLRAEYMSTNDQLKKTAIIEEASAEFKKLGINVKSVGDAQRILVNQGDAVIAMIREQGNAAAYAALRMEAFKKSFNMLMENGYDAKSAAILAGYNKDVMQFDEMLTKSNQTISKLQKQLGISNEKVIKSNGKKTKKAVKDVQDDINKAEIDAMRDGLNKKLMQLEEEKRQTLNKLKENGQATEVNIKRVEESFYKKRVEIIKDYLKELDDAVKKTAMDIQETTFTINTKELEQDIKNYTTKNWSLGQELPQDNQLFMSYEADGRSLSDSLDERLKNYKDYYAAYIKEIQDNYRKIKTIRDAQIKLERKQEDAKLSGETDARLVSLSGSLETAKYEADEFKKRNDILIDDNKKTYKELLDIVEEYRKQIADVEVNYALKSAQIEKEMKQKLQDNWIESNENIQEQQNRYYESQISNFRDFLSKMNNEVQKQPKTDKYGFGIVDIKKTKQNYEEIVQAANVMQIELLSAAADVRQAYKDGLIDAESFNAFRRELIDLQNDLDSTTQTAVNNQKQVIGQFIASINEYVQYLGSQLTSLMQSIWEYQDAQYEYEMNQLEKQIDEYAELLDKQREITEQHKDAIDDIEDELATSRGDRRQHLIDQLNEEIAAQRRSMIEQKRIEREEEKLKKKKEREEEAQRKREHKRQVQQAFISWHLSIANGLATQPFMPVGLAMGALATALGAVQYALVKSQKYADGGVIQGKSHAQGGVKVLGGRAEVEGGEFITNKRTTAQNLDLLEYINSKRKKVDINDLIEFYNGGKIRKNISNVRTKFADGGVVPSLRTDIDINDRLLTAIESYAERDVVVSVVDINKRQQAVKNVQVLAGLND